MPPATGERPREEEERKTEEPKDDDGSWIDGPLLSAALSPGASVVGVHAQRALGKGENFLSVLHRVRVEYRDAASDAARERHLMVKGLPPGEFMQTFIEETGVFRRELLMYSEVLPRLYVFADARLGNGAFQRFSAAFTKTERPDTLILDDLREEGFVMANRKDRLDLAHAKLVIASMARLHALSVAYDQRHSGFIAQFEDTMFSEQNRERLHQFIPPQVKGIAGEVAKWEGYQTIADKLEAIGDTCTDRLIDVCKTPEGTRTVLIHGDGWVNNILFKYSQTGEPIDMRFVDFQLARDASPAVDLTYFVYSSLRTEVRTGHFDDLMQYYCECFETWARKLGYTGPLMAVEELKREMERMLFFAFTSALTTGAIVLGEADDSPDLSELTIERVEEGDMYIFNKVFESPRYREAFQSLLPFFDERGVFD